MESVASMDEADRNAMGDAVRLHPYSIDSAGLAQHCAVGGKSSRPQCTRRRSLKQVGL